MMKFTVTVQETHSGDLYIELPKEALDTLGLNHYDNLVWVIEDDGTILLRKNIDDSSNPSNET